MADCPSCNHSNPVGAHFCMACGVALARTCVHCSAPLPEEARFCPACGTSVGTAKSGDQVEMIKLVTILFADVVGSTAQAEGMRPEDVRELMADFLEAMTEEITVEGGIVERFIGDALMADFGIPTAHEDDPLRAVRAAFRMLRRLETWNESRPPEHQMKIRIGINTGEVSAGGSLGQKLLVMGDSVNVAARLESIAEPGQVVVGPRTARGVRHHFDLRPLEPVSLKGISEPVPAFVIEREKVAGARSSFVAPLIGRREQLFTLQESFEYVRVSESPRTVTILGEPGIGKTRLVAEFLARDHENGQILAGRCLAHGEGVTLWPLREMLRNEATVFGTDPEDVALAKIADFVAARLRLSGAEASLTASALASTIGLELGLEALGGLDPRQVYREVLNAWARLLTALASEAPVIVLIEDLHWADRTLIDILQGLPSKVSGPVLFLCTARPDLLVAQPDWIAGLTNHSVLSVEPLELEESASLVNALLGAEDLPDAISERILERAEGNPFFLEEVVEGLIDQGYLRREDGQWIADPRIADVEIPDNVQSVILSRIDLLEPTQKRVLQLAAVIGRVFWAGTLARLAEGTEVAAALAELKRRRLIIDTLVSSLPGEEEYLFKHVLIRDVAYESLPRRARGEAHRDAGRWIEQLRGSRVNEVAELLTHHYENAYKLLGDNDLRERARAFALLAGRNALRRFALGQAESFGNRALELSVRWQDRLNTLEELGDIYMVSGRGDDAWRTYVDALAQAKLIPGDEAQVARIAASAAILATRWEPTIEEPPSEDEIENVIQIGLSAAGEDDSRERCLLLASGGFLARSTFDETSAPDRLAREALDIAERLRRPELISVARDAITYALLPELRFAEVERQMRNRVELVPQLNDAKEICDIYGSAAWSAVFVGHYRDAERYATQCLDRARGLDPSDYLHALAWRSQARFMIGDWDGALEDATEIERFEHERPDSPSSLAMRAYGVASFCHELRGDIDESDRYLNIVRSYTERIDLSSPSFAGLLTFPARTLAHRGDPSTARGWLFLQRTPYLGLNLEAACDVICALEDWDMAGDVLRLADIEIPSGQLSALVSFMDRLRGRLELAASNVDEAIDLFKRAADGFHDINAPWEEAISRMWLIEAATIAGQPDRAADDPRRAQEIFEALGSKQELTRIRDLASSML